MDDEATAEATIAIWAGELSNTVKVNLCLMFIEGVGFMSKCRETANLVLQVLPWF